MDMRVILPMALTALVACTPPPPEMRAEAQAASPPALLDDTQLARHHWHLLHAVDASGAAIGALLEGDDPPIQIDFRDGRIAVSNICNRMGGGFFVAADRLQVDQLVTTRMLCAESTRMAREEAIRDFLQTNPRLALHPTDDGPQLVLLADDQRKLTFTGTLTVQARYGGSGEIVFLEVAGDMVDCAQGKCLRVRERGYDASGLQDPGDAPWQVLETGIDGYAHESGVPTVLRTRRFETHDPQTNRGSTAFMLDMIVENHLLGQDF